jgi:hypothetical protein
MCPKVQPPNFPIGAQSKMSTKAWLGESLIFNPHLDISGASNVKAKQLGILLLLNPT